MEWKVVNAVNRDVERQHLNKILKDIQYQSGQLSDRVSQVGDGLNQTQQTLTNTIVKVINNTVPADSLVTKVTLTGDVTGTSTAVPGQNAVTVDCKLEVDFLQDAPVDANAYWRRQGQWEAVPFQLFYLNEIDGTGYAVWNDEQLTWVTRQVTGTAGRIISTNPDGAAGNTVLDLATVIPTTGGTLQAITIDGYGRVTGTRLATITGTSQQIDVANGTAATGVPTISLADLPNSGVGTAIYKTTRDTKGRISGQVVATTDDLPESSTPANQWFTAARVRAVALAGLSTVTNAAITASDTVLSSLGKLQAQITALVSGQSALSAGAINGLGLGWVSGTSISVRAGVCALQSGALVQFTSATTVSGLALSASTQYAVYAYLSGSTPSIEVSSTAPTSPYYGTARSKTGDASRRYLGSIITDASGAISQFSHSVDRGEITYTNPGNTRRVLSAGTATSATLVSCSSHIPLTAVSILARYLNTAPAGSSNFYCGPGNATLTVNAWSIAVFPGSQAAFGYCPVDSSGNIYYLNSATPTSGGGFVDILGYAFER